MNLGTIKEISKTVDMANEIAGRAFTAAQAASRSPRAVGIALQEFAAAQAAFPCFS